MINYVNVLLQDLSSTSSRRFNFIKKIMKKLILLTSLVLLYFPTIYAQSQDFHKNLVKLNLTGLLLNNYEIQYERSIAKKISLSGRLQPYGKIPAISTLTTLIDDQDLMSEIEKFRLGNTVITSEFRFYLGKYPGTRGFYIAPFARFSNISAGYDNFLLEVESNDGDQEIKDIDFNGDIQGLTGGLMFGSQWRLGKSVYLDWWIIGASLGSSSGLVQAIAALSPDEQDFIQQELSGLEIPFLDYQVEVNNSGARLNFDGPFATLRAGITLGIGF